MRLELVRHFVFMLSLLRQSTAQNYLRQDVLRTVVLPMQKCMHTDKRMFFIYFVK